jgi:hypothetical protein
MTLVSSKTRWCWLAGIPIISQITWSGSWAAISVTKSTSPFGATASTISVALVAMWASIWAMLRGVNAFWTIQRSFEWRGASMAIMEPKNSLISTGRSPMFTPLPEMKTSGLRLAFHTSSKRVRAQ